MVMVWISKPLKISGNVKLFHAKIKARSAAETSPGLINGINVLAAILEDYDVDMIKSVADAVINKYENCLVILANVNNNHVNIIGKSNADKVNCGALVKELSISCKGNGGGSKTFAQGGGSDATNLVNALTKIKEELKEIN